MPAQWLLFVLVAAADSQEPPLSWYPHAQAPEAFSHQYGSSSRPRQLAGQLPPQFLRWSVATDVSMDMILEAQLSEPIQLGTAPIELIGDKSQTIAYFSAQIHGASLRLAMPANVLPATDYQIVVRPGAIVNFAGHGNKLAVKDIRTAGPVSGWWSCNLGVKCIIKTSVDEDFNESQIAVVPTGLCNAHAFNHPRSRTQFLRWTTASDVNDPHATYDLGTPSSNPGIYDLCWRSGPEVAYSAFFGQLLLAGPNTCSAMCLRGRSCPLEVSGFQVPGGTISAHSGPRGNCDGDPIAELVLDEELNGSSSVIPAAAFHHTSSGNYTLCWRLHPGRAIFCGMLSVSGPIKLTGARGAVLEPAASKPFELHVFGNALAMSDSIAFVNDEDCLQNESSKQEGDDVESQMQNSSVVLQAVQLAVSTSPWVGFTASRKTSLRWTVPGMPAGNYTLCWWCFGCDPVPVGRLNISLPLCGNGKREALEACDDGNMEPDDGCSPNCQLEPGFDCESRASLPDFCREVIDLMLSATASMTGDPVTPVSNLISGLPWLLSSIEGSALIELPGLHQLRSVRFEMMFSGQMGIHIETHKSGLWKSLARLPLDDQLHNSSSWTFQDTESQSWAKLDSQRHVFVSTLQPHLCTAIRVTIRLTDRLGQASGQRKLHKYNWNCRNEVKKLEPCETIDACQRFCFQFDYFAFYSKSPETGCRCYVSCASGEPVAQGWQSTVYQTIQNISDTGPVSPWGLRSMELIGVAEAVNCSLAPDCRALHRLACEDGRVDHQCGDCRDNWVGKSGPSVDRCSPPQVQECLTDDWADWSSCSRTCGIGWFTRTRSIVQYPDEGADDCPLLEEKRRCNLGKCNEQAPFCVTRNASETTVPSRRLSMVRSPRLLGASGALQANTRRLQDAGNEELAELEASIMQLGAGLQIESESEDQSCQLSAAGVEQMVRLQDIVRGKPNTGCSKGFYIHQMITRCITADSDQCDKASGGFEPGCYLVHCCEQCAADCAECFGPAIEDCLVCGSGKLLFLHESGRRQCITSATCAKLGCFRPTADGKCERDLKRWDCDADAVDHEQDKIEQLEPVNDSCAPTLAPRIPRACSEQPSLDCSDEASGRLCFYDDSCRTAVGTATSGCGAGGYPNCRWCGFDGYVSCPLGRRLQEDQIDSRTSAAAQRAALKFQAARAVNKLKGYGKTKLKELVVPHLESFLKKKVQDPLLDTLRAAVGHAIKQSLSTVAQSFMLQAKESVLDFFNVVTPTVSLLSDRLQSRLAEKFGPDLPHNQCKQLSNIASKLLPPFNVQDSQDTVRIRQVYQKVQEQATPVIQDSACHGVRLLLRQAGVLAVETLLPQADAILNESWQGIHVTSVQDELPRVFAMVAEGRGTLSAELSRTMQVDVLAVVNHELLQVESELRETARGAMHALLPQVFDVGNTEAGQVQRVVDFFIHKIQGHSVELIQSSLHMALKDAASHAASSEEPVGALEVALDKGLASFRSGVLSFGQIFNVDLAMTLDSILPPAQRQLKNILKQLISGTASSLISTIVRRVDDIASTAVERVGDAISNQVNGLGVNLIRTMSTEMTKALEKDGNVFDSVAEAVKKVLGSLPKQIKKQQLVSQIWSNAKKEVGSSIAELKNLVKTSIYEMQDASGQLHQDSRKAVNAATQDAIFQVLLFVASRVVSSVLAPDIVLHLVDAIAATEVGDALQAAAVRLAREQVGSVLSLPEPASSDSSFSLDATLQQVEQNVEIVQNFLQSMSTPSLADKFKVCMGSEAEQLHHEIAEIMVQIASKFAVQQLQKHFFVTTLSKHTDQAPVDAQSILKALYAVLQQSLGHCFEPLVSSELVKFSLQTVAKARAVAAQCSSEPAVMHLSFQREVATEKYTTGKLRVNISGDQRLLLEFAELGLPDRIPAGIYSASVQALQGSSCGVDNLVLEMVPDHKTTWITCGTFATEAVRSDRRSLLVANSSNIFGTYIALLESASSFARVLELAREHSGEILVTVHDESTASIPWEQSVEEQFARLAHGAHASADAAESAKTHGAQGWALHLDVCGSVHCAYVSVSGSRCAIAFGGSSQVLNWATGSGSFQDMQSLLLSAKQKPARFQASHSEIDVHQGVLEIYENIKQSPNWELWIQVSSGDTRCSEVHVLGHGLGGAVAVLHHLERPQPRMNDLRTYGAPRIFNASHPTATCERARRFWLQDGQCSDPVASMPAALQHDWMISSPLQLNKDVPNLRTKSGSCGDNSGSTEASLWDRCRLLHLPENYLAAFHTDSPCDDAQVGGWAAFVH